MTDNDEISIDIDNQLHKWFLIDQHNHRGIIYTIFTLYLDHFLWFDRWWPLWFGFLDSETITKLISWISFLFLWTFFFQATYVQLTDGSWIRNTTFCFGHGDTCTSEQIIVSPPAVIESPGVIYTTYYDLPLYMNMEER